MPYFDQAHYIAQKVAQMNATHYQGRTGSADTVWTAELAEAELAAWNTTWEENFNLCNGSGYASSITAADINVSANPLFNVDEYAQALANYNNANSVNGQTSWTAASAIADVLNNQHQSLLSHYTHVGASLGLNPSNAFDTMAWAEAQAASTGQSVAEILGALQANGQNPLDAYFAGGGTVDAAPAVAGGAAVTVPADFDPWEVSTGGDTPGGDTPVQPVYTNTIYLTPELDVVQGTDANDHIIGQEFDGVNTLQSGDRIDGGSGTDLLSADVTAGNTYGQILNTVRPEVHNVENIKFTSQQSTDTTHGETAIAGIRADRIDGMTQLWSSNSRATLVVDDVRVDSTKMTIGWQDADNAHFAGNEMDYVVRYNNQFIKALDATTQGTLVLNVIDTEGYLQGEPLLDNPYDTFEFLYNGTTVTLRLNPDLISGASATYETLLLAFEQALAASPVAGEVTASLGDRFVGPTAWESDVRSEGTSIVLTAANGTLADPGRAWQASAGLPSTTTTAATVAAENVQDCPLYQTDIALDNVGMVNWADPSLCIPDNQVFGDYAGDMIVGGMGEGGYDAYNYVGLQRFNVTVDRGSWMSSLQSTNHALRMVVVRNGDLDDADTTVGTSGSDQGNLFIGDGQRLHKDYFVDGAREKMADYVAGSNLMFAGRDGMLADAKLLATDKPEQRSNPDQANEGYYVGQTVDSGVVDVAVFNAAAMTGKANIAAAITDQASKKYLGDTDQVDALGNRFAPGQAFSYSFGENDDTLNMSVDGNVAADNDFKLNINMGHGNNNVHISMETDATPETPVDPADPSAGTTPGTPHQNWIVDQWLLNNTVVATGNGEDIINAWGNGRVNVIAGAGDDVVYSDNSGLSKAEALSDTNMIEGAGAIWVLNAVDGKAQVEVNDLGDIVPYQNDFISKPVSSYSTGMLQTSDGRSARLEVTVRYQGLVGMADATLNMNIDPTDNTQGTFSIDTKTLNNLIRDAVNDDSRVDDRVHTVLMAKEGAGNTLMLISKIDGEQLDNGVAISFKLTQGSNTDTDIASQLMNGGKAITSYFTDESQFAQNADEEDVKGGDSKAYASNIINLGAGDDVAVLSSSVDAHEVVVLNGGDNGYDAIVRFKLSGDGQDYLDVSNILGAQAGVEHSGGTLYRDTKAVVSAHYTGGDNLGSIESNDLVSGDEIVTATQIVFLENVAKTDDDYIATAGDLLALINNDTTDNPHYNNTLFMVYENQATNPTDATFTMYKAAFGANGGCDVTAQGTISFFDDEEGNGSTLSSVFADQAVTAKLGVIGVGPAMPDIPDAE